MRGVLCLAALLLAAAWLLPPIAAEQPGGVVPAVFDASEPLGPARLADQPPAANAKPVLLLRNGEIIQGQVRRCGDRYEVEVPGGEIFVRAAEVQHECQDLHEAYQHRLALIRRDNVLDRLQLSQWCMKVGLWDSAARELAEATSLDPRHPLIPVLDRRLKFASAPPPAESGAAAAPVGPTRQELDRMVRGMPPKTVETFAQAIQPMLVNNCSAAACHGPSASNGFRLLRMPTDSPPSRLLTQRNLHAALEWLDRDNPAASPLLTYATQAHGAARVPVFTDRQVIQFRQLRDWCYRVAMVDNAVTRASYHEPLGSSGSQKSSPPERDSGTVDLRSGAAGGPRRAIQRGSTDPKSESPSADPFDPESFNRRFATPSRSSKRAKPSEAPPRPNGDTAAGL